MQQTLQPVARAAGQLVAAQTLHRNDRTSPPRHYAVQFAQGVAVAFEQHGVVVALNNVVWGKQLYALLVILAALIKERTPHLVFQQGNAVARLLACGELRLRPDCRCADAQHSASWPGEIRIVLAGRPGKRQRRAAAVLAYLAPFGQARGAA